MKRSIMRVTIGALSLGLLVGVTGCHTTAKVPPDLMARLEAATNKAEAAANKADAAAKAASDAAARAEAAADKLGTRYRPYK
jgi:outer membrane murein-binding lipoprotein Lpp